jgi:murein biosynthesis integral membrane protein MurJ
VKKIFFRGGVLLGGSAILSKFLGLFRDRLLLETFSPEKMDLVFAAFRIPDFFYFLLVGATVAVVFLPKAQGLDEEQEKQFFSSFLWGIAVFFGLISCGGIIAAPILAKVFAAGFAPNLRLEIVELARFLFGSVFLLSLSATFAAFLQHREKFLSIAIAPVFYTGSICLGVFVFKAQFGLLIIGFSAIFGAFLHFLINVFAFFQIGGRVGFYWKKPMECFRGLGIDLWRRVFNNMAFQINQSADVLIASFLVAGTTTAFSIGSNLGHVLLSIVGFSVANSAFPKLAKNKNNHQEQKKILKKSILWISFFTIPVATLGFVLATPLLQILFKLEGIPLEMTTIVFQWTVVSLPFACLTPLFSRVFFANDNSKTPLLISSFSLFIATLLAGTLALFILPREQAILGLAIGNFTANILSSFCFGFVLWKKYFLRMVRKKY